MKNSPYELNPASNLSAIGLPYGYAILPVTVGGGIYGASGDYSAGELKMM